MNVQAMGRQVLTGVIVGVVVVLVTEWIKNKSTPPPVDDDEDLLKKWGIL